MQNGQGPRLYKPHLHLHFDMSNYLSIQHSVNGAENAPSVETLQSLINVRTKPISQGLDWHTFFVKSGIVSFLSGTMVQFVLTGVIDQVSIGGQGQIRAVIKVVEPSNISQLEDQLYKLVGKDDVLWSKAVYKGTAVSLQFGSKNNMYEGITYFTGPSGRAVPLLAADEIPTGKEVQVIVQVAAWTKDQKGSLQLRVKQVFGEGAKAPAP